ncbi:MAG: phosphoglycerate kinase [Candidatus Vogelbacteria bacterium RIFOXYD1_FULL_44_32]|uniref:Phosphoglycerate kinase n=1 Tax=Candidatus Vogelbacteria bacterium RIFOXYD1_FULL_44_32 TaxID=1802438 RepID=A0A1G2QEI6_9BACT|nr:MAG: phosphoglycerate kinase [Candidatus Vogelbacteria bacterium RIFOXYD1_FULL_44_32]
MSKLPFKTITDLKTKDLKGNFVLVRTDFNVPIAKGKVLNDSRLLSALPTLKYLAERGAKVLVVAHLGRAGTESLAPVARALEPHLKIGFSKLVFDEARFKAMPNGSVMLLENIRRHEEEEKNDKVFAKRLAGLADIYINDAFSASHRAHASIVGVPKYLPSFAGLAFAKEYTELSKVNKAGHPFVLILGGAKFETKLPVIKKLLPRADFVFVGGALAHPLWHKLGYEIGKSLVGDGVKGLVEVLKDKKIQLPIDVVVKTKDGRVVKKPEGVRKQDNIQDAGPATIDLLKEKIIKAKFVLWNGPVGNFEKGFSKGTEEIAVALVEATGYSMVGGGDTVAALERHHLSSGINYISMSGGAMLEFIAKGTLPGIKALEK